MGFKLTLVLLCLFKSPFQLKMFIIKNPHLKFLILLLSFLEILFYLKVSLHPLKLSFQCLELGLPFLTGIKVRDICGRLFWTNGWSWWFLRDYFIFKRILIKTILRFPCLDSTGCLRFCVGVFIFFNMVFDWSHQSMITSGASLGDYLRGVNWHWWKSLFV